jgi:glyoxylase-like metal-dependent hydrolase (beta-lactamase superfamily II)
MARTMSLEELKNLRDSGDAFLLDLRKNDAYEGWKIEGRGVTSVNILMSRLLADGPDAYPELPRDKEIVTVCAVGKTAIDAADLLEEHGYKAVALQGGMQAWSEWYEPVVIADEATYTLVQVVRPAKGCLSYFLASGKSALVVDPGRNIDVYLDLAKQHKVKIDSVWDTHVHADHISGATRLAKQTGATYAVAEGSIGTGATAELTPGTKLRVGQVEVVAVPLYGHTPGHTGVIVDATYLLSGDALFLSGIGRPDLGGQAETGAKQLYQTLTNVLPHLPRDLVVLPTHFSGDDERQESGQVSAKLNDVMAENGLLDVGAESTFVAGVIASVGESPPNYETIRRINMGLAGATETEASDLEVGPNRCAVKAK